MTDLVPASTVGERKPFSIKEALYFINKSIWICIFLYVKNLMDIQVSIEASHIAPHDHERHPRGVVATEKIICLSIPLQNDPGQKVAVDSAFSLYSATGLG